MKILFLSPIVPYPPLDGDRQRAYHLLKGLAAEHEVHLICFWRTVQDRRGFAHLNTFCASVQGVRLRWWQILWNAAWGCLGSKPLNVAAFASGGMRRKLKATVKLRQIEAVHAYRLRMAPYAIQAKVERKLLDYTDALFRNLEARLTVDPNNWYLQREAKALTAYEPKISAAFTHCIISSPLDRDALRARGAAKNIQVVSNGVEVTAIKPVVKLTPGARLLFVANLDYAPNAQGLEHFSREIWPLVKQTLPEASLTVVGNAPRHVVRRFRSFPDINFEGVVTDLNPFFQQTRVGICPVTVASGRQFKVIEYLAAGLPTVTTPVVAANLGVQPGEHVRVGATPKEFADQIIQLCQNQRQADQLRQAGRGFATAHFDWTMAQAELAKLYRTGSGPRSKPKTAGRSTKPKKRGRA